MSMSATSYATSSSQSLIAYNKLDGLCYEFGQFGWVPIGVLHPDGVIGPIDTSSYPHIPLSDGSEDLVVVLEDQLPLHATPPPSLINTSSSPSSQYPSIQPQQQEYHHHHPV
jgi:hypothetical protein